jgi:hypothetical protein
MWELILHQFKKGEVGKGKWVEAGEVPREHSWGSVSG